jgi:protein-S-isoprenylcysteine O-methyltransferase Ste14
MSLNTRARLGLVALGVAMALLLFIPAGSARFWQGWVYLALFIGLSALITLDLMRRDPALLERRMKGGPTAEQRGQQKIIMLGASACFIAMLVVPALDYRLGWSRVPLAGVVAGDVLFIIGYGLIARVYRENTYTAATVEVAPEQRVISTGPYAIVRHPMYASALFYLIGTPLALGSYVGFAPLAVMLPLLIWRLFDEERMLAGELPGYTEYQSRVRYRLVPHVW